MMLSDIRDWVESLGITSNVYMGKLDAKQDRSIGVYNSKHEHAYKTAIGGPPCESYGTKYVTLLVHWNKSPRDTEKAAMALFEAVKGAREVTINNDKINLYSRFMICRMLARTMPGSAEMVIEAAVIYERKGE